MMERERSSNTDGELTCGLMARSKAGWELKGGLGA